MANREFPADVIGSVDKDHDFTATVDATVARGLVEKEHYGRMPRIRCFAGSVASEAVFDEVQAVEGVASLEYDVTVYLAD